MNYGAITQLLQIEGEMEISIKIGTMPQKKMAVKYKHKLPKLGDIIWVYPMNDKHNLQRVKIDEIKSINGWIVYFAARW